MTEEKISLHLDADLLEDGLTNIECVVSGKGRALITAIVITMKKSKMFEVLILESVKLFKREDSELDKEIRDALKEFLSFISSKKDPSTSQEKK